MLQNDKYKNTSVMISNLRYSEKTLSMLSDKLASEGYFTRVYYRSEKGEYVGDRFIINKFFQILAGHYYRISSMYLFFHHYHNIR